MSIERRVPKNHNVVRRLFGGRDKDDQAKTENYDNKIKEIIEENRVKMKEKYNFDFENEVALSGRYEWFKRVGTDWVGMETKGLIENNERTPMHSRTRAECVRLQKRKLPEDDKIIPKSHVKKRTHYKPSSYRMYPLLHVKLIEQLYSKVHVGIPSFR